MNEDYKMLSCTLTRHNAGYAVGDYLMMHFIYEFLEGFSIGEYSSLQGWLMDRWALTYAMDVKERTTFLASAILELSLGRHVPGTGKLWEDPVSVKWKTIAQIRINNTESCALDAEIAGSQIKNNQEGFSGISCLKVCSIACGPFGEVAEFEKLAVAKVRLVYNVI